MILSQSIEEPGCALDRTYSRGAEPAGRSRTARDLCCHYGAGPLFRSFSFTLLQTARQEGEMAVQAKILDSRFGGQSAHHSKLGFEPY